MSLLSDLLTTTRITARPAPARPACETCKGTGTDPGHPAPDRHGDRALCPGCHGNG
jgi:DnaJ-class molecular chaperone